MGKRVEMVQGVSRNKGQVNVVRMNETVGEALRREVADRHLSPKDRASTPQLLSLHAHFLGLSTKDFCSHSF